MLLNTARFAMEGLSYLRECGEEGMDPLWPSLTYTTRQNWDIMQVFLILFMLIIWRLSSKYTKQVQSYMYVLIMTRKIVGKA